MLKITQSQSKILYTGHPRRLNDLYFLHNKGVKLNAGWVETKIRDVYGGEFNMDQFTKTVSEKQEFWKRDLKRFIPGGPPPFEEASETVVEVVREAMGAA